MSLQSSLLFEEPNVLAERRLFLFPYGGAGAAIATPYRKLLAPVVDVIPLQFPGRENRIKERAYTRMEPLIDDLIMAIGPYLDVPFSFWGHCSGAVIAFELARRVRDIFEIEPEIIFISACSAPQLITPAVGSSLHLLPDKDFLIKIQKIMQDAFSTAEAGNQALQILLSGIKADFAVYETYIYQDKNTFSCPIITFGGAEDTRVEEINLRAWQAQTTGAFECHILEKAAHFFINNYEVELSRLINIAFERSFKF